MEDFYQLRTVGLQSLVVYLIYVFLNNTWLLDKIPKAPRPDLMIILVTSMMIVSSNSILVFSMLVGVLFTTSVAVCIRRADVITSDFTDLGWILTGMIYFTMVLNALITVLNNILS